MHFPASTCLRSNQLYYRDYQSSFFLQPQNWSCVAWPVFAGTCNFAQAPNFHLVVKQRVSPWRTEPWTRLSSLWDLVASHEVVPCSWLLRWCLSCCASPVALRPQALGGSRVFRDTSSCSREVTGVATALTASSYALENALSLGPFCGYLSWKCGINLYAVITYNENSTSSYIFFFHFYGEHELAVVIFKWCCCLN